MSNPAFDFLDSGDNQGGDGDSNPMKDLRNHAKALEKELKAIQKENLELQSYKQEVESRTKREALSETFSEFGLNPKQADLFFKTRTDEDAEINPEDIKLWALEYGLISSEPVDDEDDSLPGMSPFTPVPKEVGGPPSARQLTSDEWNELLQSNPDEAMKVAQQGRVQFADSL